MTVVAAPTPLRDILAPAKLNLFLHITGRRADGYHLLQSVFMLIDWCDTLHLEWLANGEIRRVDVRPNANLPAEDLTVRAARLLQQATGCPHGVQITLDKQIPAEAGMGGGSSDAASCLIALNSLWQLGLSRTQLATIGLQLGADVPFFIQGHNAWVEGIGEVITPIRLARTPFVVVKPTSGVSTPHIFVSPSLQRNTKPAQLASFLIKETNKIDSVHGGPLESDFCELDMRSVLDFGHNDLEPVAKTLCPDVAACTDWLTHQGLQGRMTGSGSAVFAPLWTSQALVPAPPGWIVRQCNSLSTHPLVDWGCG